MKLVFPAIFELLCLTAFVASIRDMQTFYEIKLIKENASFSLIY